MSKRQPAESAECGRADHRLWERQLLLTHATYELILDHTHTLAETLQFIATETQEILNARHVDIFFLYADGLRNEISTDPAEVGRLVPTDSSIGGLVLSQRAPVMENDIRNDPIIGDKYVPRDSSGVPGEGPRVNVIVVELTLDDRHIGVMSVERISNNDFDGSHLEFVNAVARQISMAISHAALFDENDFRAATDGLLMEVTSGDSDVTVRRVLDHILAALNSLSFVRPDAADILFADPQDEQCLVVAYSTNNSDIGVRVDIDSSVSGEAFRRGSTVLLQRAFERGDYQPVVQGMRCEMAIPIVLGGSERMPIGVLNLESSRENAFSVVGQILVERFIRQVVNAVAITKIRADIDSELQDQLMVLAADQVLNAVHRVNNHVGVIRALARDLLEDLGAPSPLDPRDLAHRLEMIDHSAEQVLEIPYELRRRIGTPQESTDVNAQVESGLAAARIPKRVELVTDLATGLPNIPCTALDLVVENLALNAVQAMRGGPGTLRVTTRLDTRVPRGPFIVISVQDTGVGMTEDELARLFKPRQLGRGGAGLGFGMMWVRSWVRRAHGLIEVESEPGSGTTVNIRFQIGRELIGQMASKGDSR